jgi:hypothetical protein
MLALGMEIIRKAKIEIGNVDVEKVFGKAGLSPHRGLICEVITC